MAPAPPSPPAFAFPGLQGEFGAILMDPPWRFANRTGKMAPEHKRLRRYPTLSAAELAALPVAALAAPQCHLYLWCPNALLHEGLDLSRGSRRFACGQNRRERLRNSEGRPAPGKRIRRGPCESAAPAWGRGAPKPA